MNMEGNADDMIINEDLEYFYDVAGIPGVSGRISTPTEREEEAVPRLFSKLNLTLPPKYFAFSEDVSHSLGFTESLPENAEEFTDEFKEKMLNRFPIPHTEDKVKFSRDLFNNRFFCQDQRLADAPFRMTMLRHSDYSIHKEPIPCAEFEKDLIEYVLCRERGMPVPRIVEYRSGFTPTIGDAVLKILHRAPTSGYPCIITLVDFLCRTENSAQRKDRFIHRYLMFVKSVINGELVVPAELFTEMFKAMSVFEFYGTACKFCLRLASRKTAAVMVYTCRVAFPALLKYIDPSYQPGELSPEELRLHGFQKMHSYAETILSESTLFGD